MGSITTEGKLSGLCYPIWKILFSVIVVGFTITIATWGSGLYYKNQLKYLSLEEP